MQRWTLFLAALAGTAVLAVAFAFSVDRLLMSSPAAPHLRSISDAALSSQYGITLAAAAQPPYCGVEQTVARTGWLSAGAGGCAITRERAEADAVGTSGTARVMESLLARVSSTWSPRVHDHLSWLVVVRPAQVSPVPARGATSAARFRYCGAVANTSPAGCPFVRRAATPRVVVLDAYSGQMIQGGLWASPLTGPQLYPSG